MIKKKKTTKSKINKCAYLVMKNINKKIIQQLLGDL